MFAPNVHGFHNNLSIPIICHPLCLIQPRSRRSGVARRKKRARLGEAALNASRYKATADVSLAFSQYNPSRLTVNVLLILNPNPELTGWFWSKTRVKVTEMRNFIQLILRSCFLHFLIETVPFWTAKKYFRRCRHARSRSLRAIETRKQKRAGTVQRLTQPRHCVKAGLNNTQNSDKWEFSSYSSLINQLAKGLNTNSLIITSSPINADVILLN